MSWAWMLSTVTIVSLAYMCYPDARYRALLPLPAPKGTLPLLGNTLDIGVNHFHRLCDWITDQCIAFQGKTWRLSILGDPPIIVVSTPELFEDVQKTQFHVFDKGELMRSVLEEFLGDSLFAHDGEKWRVQRKVLASMFSVRKFRESIGESIHKHLLLMNETMNDFSTTGKVLDLTKLIPCLSFDTIMEVSFGHDRHTLQSTSFESKDGSDETEVDALWTALDATAEAVEARFYEPTFLWRLKRVLGIGQERKLRESVETINQVVYEIIYECIRRRSDPKQGTLKVDKDVISLFLELEEKEATMSSDEKEDKDRLNINAKFLRDIGMTLLLAGRDTTAGTILWSLVDLNNRSDVVNKIRKELQERLPKLFTDETFVPGFDDVESLVYLDAVVRETLRLHPAVPLNTKEANQDTVLSDGTFIKKGTLAYIPTYALHRLPQTWGDDANEFRPERWIDPSSGKIISVSPYQWNAFHAGPRQCVGQRMAMMELKTVLAHMLSKYDIHLTEKEYTYRMTSVMYVKGRVLANVKRHQQSIY